MAKSSGDTIRLQFDEDARRRFAVANEAAFGAGRLLAADAENCGRVVDQDGRAHEAHDERRT